MWFLNLETDHRPLGEMGCSWHYRDNICLVLMLKLLLSMVIFLCWFCQEGRVRRKCKKKEVGRRLFGQQEPEWVRCLEHHISQILSEMQAVSTYPWFTSKVTRCCFLWVSRPLYPSWVGQFRNTDCHASHPYQHKRRKRRWANASHLRVDRLHRAQMDKCM